MCRFCRHRIYIISYSLSAVATTLVQYVSCVRHRVTSKTFQGQLAFYKSMNLQTDESVDKGAYDYMVVVQGLGTSLSQAGGFFGSFLPPGRRVGMDV
jgi:hypothetical protein